MNRPKPLLLCILDGWGHREATEHNAIAAANTPNWDALCRDYPHSLLDASAGAVGLPEGQMGNSEVGHMHIGAGRKVLQDLPRIDTAISNGELARNETLQAFLQKLKNAGKALHLMGLLSPGGVHSHQRHLLALAKIAAQAGVTVKLHAFLDGRDTPPQSARDYLAQWPQETAQEPRITLATLSGRYYAMDRDQRWERIEKAYQAISHAEGERFTTATEAIDAAYAAGTTDEFILPCVLGNYNGMEPGDGLLMTNFRADRARQILQRFLGTSPDMNRGTNGADNMSAPRPSVREAIEPIARSEDRARADIMGMVEYSSELAAQIPALFPPQQIQESLGEVVSRQGMRQLRIAETEKYAHVTFFFNGGTETEYPGEDRVLIPSPDVATYDLQPEMSAPELTDKLTAAITGGTYDLIVCNFANTDMVGHSGKLEAAIQAVEAVDHCLGHIHQAILRAGGAMLITADHGNAEQMQNEQTGKPHTAHTTLPVPFLLAGESYKGQKHLLADGTLADIAPTCLQLLHIPQPQAMTGHSLLKG